jgi:serine/threonine-protein kinase
VPVGFDAWFARAVARDPEARFQSARELSDALREVLGGEARDLQWTSPEVLVASELTPNSQARTRLDQSGSEPRASAQVLESNSQIRLSSGGQLADPVAATLLANDGPTSSRAGPTSSRGAPISRRAESDVIAELLASAASEPPRRRSGAGLVFSVAGVALAIGLAAGWVFMKRSDPRLRPLPQAVPPAHESAAPRVHNKAPEHAASVREEPPAAASASAKPGPVAHAAAEDVLPAATPPVSKPLPSASAAAPSATADAGWVKPAWAIPDDEPRRVHVDDARDAGN